jgi:peroxiredoxin
VVLVVSFLTTCPDCLTTLQFMARLQNEFGPRGFQVVAISLDDDAGAAKPFAERYRFPFPIGHLTPPPAIKLMDLNAGAHPEVPYIFFVDWQGNVRFQYAGNDPIFAQGEKGLHGIVYGLVKQKEEKKGPEYQTRPAGKQ